MNNILSEDIENIIDNASLRGKISNKTVFVTGACGMLAGYVVYTLMALGDVKVIACTRDTEKAENKYKDYLGNANFHIMHADITIPFQYEDRIDIIIHTASPSGPNEIRTNPVGVIRSNVIGTENLLQLALQTNAEVLFLSSTAVYGKPNGRELFSEEDTGEDDEEDSLNSYIVSKRMGEFMCRTYAIQYGITASIARISQTYGPEYKLRHGSPASDFLADAVENKEIRMKSSGTSKRDFSYVSDIVTGLFVILTNRKGFSVYNISGLNSYMSTKDFAGIVALVSGQVVVAGSDEDRNYNYGMDSRKLKELGWQPRVLPIEGVSRTLRYFKENGVKK